MKRHWQFPFVATSLVYKSLPIHSPNLHSHPIFSLTQIKFCFTITMNPTRPFLRALLPFFRPAVASSSTLARIHRRHLTTPTSPLNAKVSEVTDHSDRVREDPGEFEVGDNVAEKGEGGEGEFCEPGPRPLDLALSGQRRSEAMACSILCTSAHIGFSEMFGFKLNPVATKTGGNPKSEGRPIYLDMQVRFAV